MTNLRIQAHLLGTDELSLRIEIHYQLIPPLVCRFAFEEKSQITLFRLMTCIDVA